jgi:hypothetical protein
MSYSIGAIVLRYPLRVRPRLRMRLPVAILIAAILMMVGGCSRPSGSRVTLEEFVPHGEKAAPATAAVPTALTCPPAGAPMLQPSASSTGHHKVVLTWNASSPSPHPEDNAVGYCLYRSTKKSVAKNNATCKDCEQINTMPVVGTGCVDDLVQDGALYYYVATAINAGRKVSVSSNETPAPIPANKQSAISTSTNAYPFCRGPASSK